jgi:HEPN domain-containing protein
MNYVSENMMPPREKETRMSKKAKKSTEDDPQFRFTEDYYVKSRLWDAWKKNPDNLYSHPSDSEGFY